MPSQSNLFPPLSIDTIRAAEAMPVGSIYRVIGDQIEQVFANVELARLDPSRIQPASTLAVLTLVTVFQYTENLSDQQAAEAIRIRPDWKYALHLARTYPGLEYRLLCEFRKPLVRSQDARHAFQQVLDRLAEIELFRSEDGRPLAASEVLAVVCGASRLERLTEAVRMALESMAAVGPEQLLTITLPHWYERYSQMQAARVLPKSREEQAMQAQAIGNDATYLLEAITRTTGHLTSLPEVRALHQIWIEQLDRSGRPIQWQTPICASCCSPDNQRAFNGLVHYLSYGEPARECDGIPPEIGDVAANRG